MIEALTRRTLYALLAAFGFGLTCVMLVYGLNVFETKDYASLISLVGAPCYLYVTGAFARAAWNSKENFGFKHNPHDTDSTDEE